MEIEGAYFKFRVQDRRLIEEGRLFERGRLYDQIRYVFFAFISSGTSAQDALKLIRNIQNGTLDDVLRIHEDLCTVVFSTVSAYSVWFVLHWFTYGASVIAFVMYISEEIAMKAPLMELVYLGCVLVCLLYLFLIPCMCAARITSHCAGKKIFDSKHILNPLSPSSDRHLFSPYSNTFNQNIQVMRTR